MLYYLYILNGPLKYTKISLIPNEYSILIYNKRNEIHADDANEFYIPCEDENLVKKINIKLKNTEEEQTTLVIEESVIADEIGVESKIYFDKPIYLNDTPMLLISKKANLPKEMLVFQKKTNHVKTRKKTSIILITCLFLLLSVLALFSFFDKKEVNNVVPKPTLSVENYHYFLGLKNHYCLYDESTPEWIKNNNNNQYSYIDIKKLNLIFNGESKRINNIMIKEDSKPTIAFIYHNNHEKEKINSVIQQQFSSFCQPEIKAISIPSLIEQINSLSFIKETSYQIKEEKNGITFIFDGILNRESKIKFEQFIKKQTSIFGRKFIFYRENIGNPALINKATLQEENGYIFIDSQHRYFPKG
ncbi:hypothetical protein K151_2587 [Proteus hauseri ZMd44]|nr:hypothetical protein K151_2587 [Proteus hauseri ZMd44]